MNTTICKLALEYLRIEYYEQHLSANTIFFCRTFEGTTFDIMIYPTGLIRMWRFVCSNIPENQVGQYNKYFKTELNDIVIGFEVTSEYDLKFFTEQVVDGLDSKAEIYVLKQLKQFIFLSRSVWSK